MKLKTKDDKLKYHREYMNVYREKHKERVRAQKNAARGVMPDVRIQQIATPAQIKWANKTLGTDFKLPEEN